MKLFIARSDEELNTMAGVISNKIKVSQPIVRIELNKFISYWTEKNGSGRKQKWEMEKTFEVKRRLATWFSNANKFSQRSSTKVKEFLK